MALVFTPEVMDACNALEHRKADMRFAQRVRKFRPGPVEKVNDQQLAEIVRRSREAARGFGIVSDKLVARFVMIDALIAPKFYERGDVKEHFQQASGSSDVKAGDISQWIKIMMRHFEREHEVWW